MHVEVVPLLEIQRDLYRMPRGMKRFEAYLRVMLNEDRSEPRLPPLVALNPMAKDGVAALVDALIALDAEGVALKAAAEAVARLPDVLTAFRTGLVVADDAGGGWTNRYASEFAWIAGSPAATRKGWLPIVLWSSERASVGGVREATLTALYRAAFASRHGTPETLGEFMAQEGFVLDAAGCDGPTLEAEDLEYTREVLKPFLGESDVRVVMECLFGDEAGGTLGFTPRGLSRRAGLALALRDARGGWKQST